MKQEQDAKVMFLGCWHYTKIPT